MKNGISVLRDRLQAALNNKEDLLNGSAKGRSARLFYLTFAATGSLAAAARAAGISTAEARRLRDQPVPEGLDGHPRPRREEPNPLDKAVAALEEEAVRRALFGVTEPVFHQGRECGAKAKHSDALLIFLLKALRPERYGPASRRAEGEEEDGAAGAMGAAECVPPLCVDFGADFGSDSGSGFGGDGARAEE